MVKGQEFHSIIQNIFGDVRGIGVSEQIQVCCPRCQEREGLLEPDGKFNLEINTAKRKFRCWKCEDPKFSGSLGRLVRILGSDADYQIYKSYADAYSDIDYDEEFEEKEYVPVKLPSEMIYFSQMDVTNDDHFEAYNYLLLDRKISRDIILKYRLGFCVDGKYAKRIIIPSFDKNGNVNYFVARNYDTSNKKKPPYDNPKLPKDNIIFNEGYINWDSTLYIVEGVFEMFSFPVNITPILGKVLSTSLFLKIKEMKPDIVILLDPDAYKNSIELYYQLHSIYIGCEEKVKLVKIPYEKDLDLLRKNRGVDEVIKSLYSARGLVVDDYFINSLKKPYEKRGNGRYDSYSNDIGWKSGSTKNSL